MIPVLLQYQSGSAVNTSVIAQSCQGKQCAAAALERIFLVIFLNVIQQHIAGFGNTAADYEDLGALFGIFQSILTFLHSQQIF